ncbi:MAG TPA: hypothetical protein VNU26_07960 [Mycobacteriales bacterium]|nr:hypothetical protein [Mycobacteriales bacterium]
MTAPAVPDVRLLDEDFAVLHRRERLQQEHRRELDRREAQLAARADALRQAAAELDTAWARLVARMDLVCAAERLVAGEEQPCACRSAHAPGASSP